jgi:hypothetical protein
MRPSTSDRSRSRLRSASEEPAQHKPVDRKFLVCSSTPVTRFHPDLLANQFEEALAVAPQPLLAGLGANDCRAQHRARIALAQHLAERMASTLDDPNGVAQPEDREGLFSRE